MHKIHAKLTISLRPLWGILHTSENVPPHATGEFYAVITGSNTTELIRWMKRFWKTSITTLKTFIIGIMKDFKAVRNTIWLNITNGITEGYVNKLKAVKRLMYGRAGIELLKNKLVLEHVLFN